MASTSARALREVSSPPDAWHRGTEDESDVENPESCGNWSEDEDHRPLRPAVQWRVARSAALVFLGIALAIGGALFLVRSSEPSAAAVTVQLDAEEPGPRSVQASPDTGSEGGLGAEDRAPEGFASSGSALPEQAPSAGATSAGQPGGSGAAGAGDTGQGTMVVYVTGAVASPGVVVTAPGARLFEIIEKAGGSTPDADLEGINLAATPTDGEHIHLLAIGEEPRPDHPQPRTESGAEPTGGSGGTAPGPGGVGSRTGADGGIDINTATLTELQSLPRIGPVLGQRILDWRMQNGPFVQPTDLDAVPGIGPAMLEGILPLIVVR